jgi:hypothetical protein
MSYTGTSRRQVEWPPRQGHPLSPFPGRAAPRGLVLPLVSPSGLGQLTTENLPEVEEFTSALRSGLHDTTRTMVLVGTGVAAGAVAGLAGGLLGRWWAGLLLGGVAGGVVAYVGREQIAARFPAPPAAPTTTAGLSGVLAVM